jgi:protein-tyrosine kinase
MSVDPVAEGRSLRQKELEQTLVAHCALSDEKIERIRETMRDLRLSFSEAAVRSEVVTQRELDKVIDSIASAPVDESSIVETIMRRRTQVRDVAVRRNEMVAPTPELILAHDPDSPRCERLRALRTELLLLDDTPSQTSTFALLSPSSSEGRSLLAAELAIAFSQLRRRTLLIDGDLRRPRQHALFGSNNSSGLAQSLAFGTAPHLASVNGLPHLTLLTAGPLAPNPLELLSDGRFARLLADWQYSYDFILIDSPPVSQFADGLAIATSAGRALVLSRAAKTARRDMKDMMRRLGATQARVMGAVLNHF